jgi:hypothetical protein
MMKNIVSRRMRVTAVMGLFSAVSMSSAYAAPVSDVEAQAQESWRETMHHTAVPFAEGCFQAEYPSTLWQLVKCVKAPDIMYLPSGRAIGETVGNGNDYGAEVSGLISSAVGSFPTVTGVKTERDGLRSNVYSIQLNTNFMNTAVCNGHSNCLSWEQFVYSSSEQSAFMQYWMINYGTCPRGWNSYSGSCYKNSAAVSVPKQAITSLASLKMSGAGVNGGIDTLVFTTPTKAYSTTGSDSVLDMATGWSGSEFNIIGDGGGTKASFNTGSSVTVKLAVDNGTTAAPTCKPDDGTTGETNNLNLKTCTTAGGSSPYIQFVESN